MAEKQSRAWFITYMYVYVSKGPKFIRALHCDFKDMLCFARRIGFITKLYHGSKDAPKAWKPEW
jgi:hypothetical protein